LFVPVKLFTAMATAFDFLLSFTNRHSTDSCKVVF
jgi:hypothetical protein